MVQFGLFGMPAASFGLVILLFVIEADPIAIIVLSIVSMFMLSFAITMKNSGNKIPFAAANIHVASTVVKKHREVIMCLLFPIENMPFL